MGDVDDVIFLSYGDSISQGCCSLLVCADAPKGCHMLHSGVYEYGSCCKHFCPDHSALALWARQTCLQQLPCSWNSQAVCGPRLHHVVTAWLSHLVVS